MSRALPTQPPLEVVRLAKAAFSTDQLHNGAPILAVGSDPFLACERAIRATWKGARLVLAGQPVPDPPGLPTLGRCTTCATALRSVPTEASGGSELISLEVEPHLGGTVAIVATEAGPRARVYPDRIAAQVAGGTRYRPHEQHGGATQPRSTRQEGQPG